MGDMFNEHYLWASLIWGSVASGYIIYGWKLTSGIPLAAGAAMMMVSIFVSSWFWMSLVSVALMFGAWQLLKRGD